VVAVAVAVVVVVVVVVVVAVGVVVGVVVVVVVAVVVGVVVVVADADAVGVGVGGVGMKIDVNIETRRTEGETAGNVSDKVDLFKKIARQFGWALTDVELHSFGWGHKGSLTFDLEVGEDEDE